MSQRLISLSPDLKRLRDEGYEVSINENYLVLASIPYVNSERIIKRGALISELTLAGDLTVRPHTHVVDFVGEHPCHKDGSKIFEIELESRVKHLTSELVANHSFSNKPTEGYENFYEKMTTYANIISGPAEALDANVTAKTFPVITNEGDDSVFNYLDTSSSRAGISSVTNKLKGSKVGIIGLGGTGSYVLDLVAKTPVAEIHLFDGDNFLSHNAFRSPGVASIEELRQQLHKAQYYKDKYSLLRRGIFAHNHYLDEATIGQIQQLNFAFICLDNGSARKLAIENLIRYGIDFIDVGMGVYLREDSLGGILRITTSTIDYREHIAEHVSFLDDEGNNEYAQNIQIVELNALSAAYAVIKWKKLSGFYTDLAGEHHSTYTIDVNALINEEQ